MIIGILVVVGVMVLYLLAIPWVIVLAGKYALWVIDTVIK